MRGFIWFSGNEVLLLNRRAGANLFQHNISPVCVARFPAWYQYALVKPDLHGLIFERIEVNLDGFPTPPAILPFNNLRQYFFIVDEYIQRPCSPGIYSGVKGKCMLVLYF